MIIVFKTTVENNTDSQKIVKSLKKEFPGSMINFDLEDSDNILRVEGESVDKNIVKRVVADYKFEAVLLIEAASYS